MGWTASAKRGLHRVAHRSGASVYWARRQPGLHVLKFHGVGGDLYPAEALATELAYLRRHFPIVPLASVVAYAREGKPGRRHGIALTFDDGLRNNFTVAYPILERLGIPATFFVCPALIDRGDWLWNHEVRVRVRAVSAAARAELARRVGAPASEPDAMVSWMKTLPGKAREDAQDAIRLATAGFRPTREQAEQYDMMTWDDLLAMDPDVVTVGGHTLTHPVLPRLEPADVARELSESQQQLEARLGRPVEHFCYPFGAWNPTVANHVRRWYCSAVTSDPGRVGVGDDLFTLRRVSATPRLDLLTWRLHRPAA